MAAVLPDTDSEDELPPGWEERTTLDGSVYYVKYVLRCSHGTKGTQWTHPRTGKKKKVFGDLPPNWERTIEGGSVVYIDHSTGRKTYADPRLAFAIEEKEHFMDIRQRFDASTTAEQVLHGVDLSGKVFLITGATSGIGFETARSLAKHGAEIIMCGRSEASCKDAEMKILLEKPSAKLRLVQFDLADLNSVKLAASTISLLYEDLDVIILNAGILAVGWQQTVDGLESVFQVNHLAHFYLTLLLRDRLQRGSRVVVLSSESHRFSNINRNNMTEEKVNPSSRSGYWHMMMYNNSKLCNVLFGMELQRRWANRDVDVFMVHPGNLIATNLARHSCLYRFLFAIVRPFTKSVQQGAATSVFAAVAPELRGSGGLYLNNCCPCEISKEGKDEALAKMLWWISEDILTRKGFPPTIV